MKTIWNDTDIPLAYLITFRTYRTWLHGDERGSVDRFHNKYGAPKIAANEKWLTCNTKLLKKEPFILKSKQRKAV